MKFNIKKYFKNLKINALTYFVSFTVIFIIIILIDGFVRHKWIGQVLYLVFAVSNLFIIITKGDKIMAKKKKNMIDLNEEVKELKFNDDNELEVDGFLDEGVELEPETRKRLIPEDKKANKEFKKELLLRDDIQKAKKELALAQKKYLEFKGVA
jgi:hypothetical protein